MTLRYFDGCPNWRIADAALHEALVATGKAGVSVDYETVNTAETAELLGFIGSPTILIDDNDPFADPNAQPGLACRLYHTPEGMRGSPTVQQLVDVLR